MIFIILGFVGGAWLLQQQASLPSVLLIAVLLIVVAVVSLLLFLSTLKYRDYSFLRMVGFFVVAGSLGYMYTATRAEIRLSDSLPSAWEQKNIEVVGVVASMPEVRSQQTQFRFLVEQVRSPGARVPKHILLNHYQGDVWQQMAEPVKMSPSLFGVGQRWHLTIRLKRPHTTYNPNGYDFEAWAFANDIRAIGVVRKQYGMQKVDDFVWRPSYVIDYCREKVAERITRVLEGKPYAGVIRALVVGDDSRINKHDWDVYLHTGVNHLMSISGLHITMLAGFAFVLIAFMWRRFTGLVLLLPARKAATLGGALVALLYACLAGLSVPTQRTLYMLAVVAVALLVNQRINLSRVLAIALFVVVLFDPWAVIAPGFWLSFSAVTIITYASAYRMQIRHWLIEAMNTQWAVTLGLLPFLIYMFGQASIVSPIANAFAIPVISFLVVPLSIIGSLAPLDFILQLAHGLLAIGMVGLNGLASLPYATWQQVTPPFWCVALGAIGVLWLLLPRGFPQRWLGLILMLPMVFVQPPSLALGEMGVAVLDVGQGLSVVIRTANHIMLYDTGRRYNYESDAGERIVLPYLRRQGINKLDALIVSHNDNDHNGGLASILATLPVSWVASSYLLPDDITVMPSQTAKPRQFRCHAGQQWVWDAVRFEVLSPTLKNYQDAAMKDNDKSCVIKVSGRYGSVLLAGDIEAQAEAILVSTQAEKLKSDVLIAPHHGSKTSSTQSFIEAAGADYVIFTVGYLNRFKHPRPRVMSHYLVSGAQLYRSDHHGAVLIDFSQSHALAPKSWRQEQPRYWHDKYL